MVESVAYPRGYRVSEVEMGDVASWDDRYRAAGFVWSTHPNRFLPPEIEGISPTDAIGGPRASDRSRPAPAR